MLSIGVQSLCRERFSDVFEGVHRDCGDFWHCFESRGNHKKRVVERAISCYERELFSHIMLE